VQIDVKKPCTWFGINSSITKEVSVTVNEYYTSNKVTSTFGRTGCIPDIPCNMVPDATVVQRGGTLGIQATATNNDVLPQTFYFATFAIKPDGNRYPSSGWLYGPVTTTLDAGATSQSVHISQQIPANAPLGPYNYYGYTGVLPGTKYNECQFLFTVIP
jgi:hypothetical protein